MERSEIAFLVQGSAADPYMVRFVNRGNGNVSAYCNCPAGDKGQVCKHRMNIINGNSMAIVTENISDVDIVRGWIAGSDIEESIRLVNEAEQGVTAAKAALNRAKKHLAAAMLD